jgi:hypothetical protein
VRLNKFIELLKAIEEKEGDIEVLRLKATERLAQS